MALPVKAFVEGQFEFLAGDKTALASGHEVKAVRFKNVNGDWQKGYFKPVSVAGAESNANVINSLCHDLFKAEYPELLAKISVATSVAIRMVLGDFAAEDRLVFNKAGRIIGTISYDIGDRYKPLQSPSDPPIEDEKERKLRDPDVDTLLEHNVLRQLAYHFFGFNDDLTPFNFLMEAALDWDMFHYIYTAVIRGARALEGYLNICPRQVYPIKSIQLRDFPIADGLRTHNPANERPANRHPGRYFKSKDAFRQLAANEEGQKQWMEAFLEILTKHDPEALKLRLKEYIGDELFDYCSLSADKVKELEKLNPKLFNKKADLEPFVDFYLKLQQEEYDALYRSLVWLPGYEKNIAQFPVPSYDEFLTRRPQAIQRIQELVKKENQKIEKISASPKPDNATILDSWDMPAEGLLNPIKVNKRYHQIWRDSHLPYINSLLNGFQDLEDTLLLKLKLEKYNAQKKEFKFPDQTESTQAAQLLTRNEHVKVDTSAFAENDEELLSQKKLLQEVLINVQQLNQRLEEISTVYYQKTAHELAAEDNVAFVNELTALYTRANSIQIMMQKLIANNEQNYKEALEKLTFEEESIDILLADSRKEDASIELLRALAKNREDYNNYSKDFCFYKKVVHALSERLNWYSHIASEDQQSLLIKDDNRTILDALKPKPFNDPIVINNAFEQLLKWADEQDPSELNDMLISIVHDYDPPMVNIAHNRLRATNVRTYLKENRELKGALKIWYILGRGKCKSNSLNTLLIKALLPEMLKSFRETPKVNFIALRLALDDGSFNPSEYAERFSQKVIQQNVHHFSDAMYKWAEKKSVSEFRTFIDGCYKKYLAQKSTGQYFGRLVKRTFFSSTDRGDDIKAIIDTPWQVQSNSLIIKQILSKGELLDSSFNNFFIQNIFDDLRQDLCDNDREKSIEEIKVIGFEREDLNENFRRELRNLTANKNVPEISKIKRAKEWTSQEEGGIEFTLVSP